jgi:hypothetical protein
VPLAVDEGQRADFMPIFWRATRRFGAAFGACQANGPLVTSKARRKAAARGRVGLRVIGDGERAADMKMGAKLVAIGDLQVGVWLHTGSDPRAEEWSASCQSVADLGKANGGDFTRFRALFVTDGGTPDARQRKELFRDALGGYPAKMSIITEAVATNALKRGIATALGWMNPNFRVFEPTELNLALEHIDIELARFDPIWECLAAMQLPLAQNATLRRIGARNRIAPSIAPARASSERPHSSGVLRAAKASRSEPGESERESAHGQRVASRSDSSRARKA